MKYAFVTQSYKADFEECSLLCESIDRFLDPAIDHFVFVNDEDYKLFKSLDNDRHKILKKSTVLPWYMIRFPWKLLGHHYHISPFTIPVREWIIQQICKLGVFEVIGDEYDAVFHVDSECVLMRQVCIDDLKNNGKYLMYRIVQPNEPSQDEYCHAAVKLLKLQVSYKEIHQWNYMCTPVCFERENTKALLETISKNSIWKNWKLALANTYRFSENYTYGLFTDYCLEGKNHFHTSEYSFPLIRRTVSEQEFKKQIDELLKRKQSLGFLGQKPKRKVLSGSYLKFETLKNTVYEYWSNYKY